MNGFLQILEKIVVLGSSNEKFNFSAVLLVTKCKTDIENKDYNSYVMETLLITLD